MTTMERHEFQPNFISSLCSICGKTSDYHTHLDVPALWAEVNQLKTERNSALELLNRHLSGRVYTDLDDALRQLLQEVVWRRDLAKLQLEKTALELGAEVRRLGFAGGPRC